MFKKQANLITLGGMMYGFLSKNFILYAGMIQVIKRNTVEILEASEDCLFLRDTISNAFMLVANNDDVAMEWLKKHEHKNYELLVLFQENIVSFAKNRYKFSENITCYQAVYESDVLSATQETLEIEIAKEEDFQSVFTYYKSLSEKELKKIIHRKELFIAYHNKEMVGFVGQHLEGSMGILEVLSPFRGRGYGKELEIFMIAYMMKNNLIPFAQIEITNEASLKLQRKLGMTISNEKLYWLF